MTSRTTPIVARLETVRWQEAKVPRGYWCLFVWAYISKVHSTLVSFDRGSRLTLFKASYKEHEEGAPKGRWTRSSTSISTHRVLEEAVSLPWPAGAVYATGAGAGFRIRARRYCKTRAGGKEGEPCREASRG